MSALVLDVGLAHKQKKAFARFGWTEEEIDKLCGGDNLYHVLAVLRGLATIMPKNSMIDTNALPYIPYGWSFLEHKTTGPRNTGFLGWNPENVLLDPVGFHGISARAERANVYALTRSYGVRLPTLQVLNASVLDHLHQNQYLVPRSWIGRHILFLGTLYRTDDGKEAVRCLYYSSHEKSWTWKTVLLNDQLGSEYVVAMLKP